MHLPADPEVDGLEVADFVQAYDAARADAKVVELDRFLPSLEHPLYTEVYRRLLLREREHRARQQDPADHPFERTVSNRGRIASPENRVPALVKGPAEIGPAESTANVPVRVRRPEDLGIGTDSRPRDFVPAQTAEGSANQRPVLPEMPAPGTHFLGFNLLAELGRGSFGRVYLAEQPDLASRYVALKVSTDITCEARALAQLQHTNIVPIHSVHRAGAYQAVCMPYFGATTAAHLLKQWREREFLPESGLELVSTLRSRKSITRQVREASTGQSQPAEASPRPAADGPKVEPAQEPLRQVTSEQGTAVLEMLEGLSFVQAVLWIASRLADGLAHAHERGILHRDLKPANILINDEGQPMLLDFSVALDTKRASGAACTAQIGGTVCYMAPEHLEAFDGATRTVDARSDLYSLGIILYEMLTRRDPFPVPPGSFRDVLPALLEARRGSPPRLRPWNKAISPAAESIIRHCLEADPADRYQSAHELREDLDRHRASLPLRYAPEPSMRERTRKWMRRHPRLTSVSSFAGLAVILTAVTLGWYFVHAYRLSQLEAKDTLSRFQEEVKNVQFVLNARSPERDQLDEGLKAGQRALQTYQVLDNQSWKEQPAVRYLSEANQVKLGSDVQEMLLLMARAALLEATAIADPAERDARLQTALHFNGLAETASPEAPGRALLAQRAELVRLMGRRNEAGRIEERALQTPLRTARDHYLVGSEHVALGRYREALPLLQTAAEQEPQNFWARLLLGICHDGLGQDLEARACYTTSIALWPQSPWAYFNRGLVYLRQGDYERAGADFDRVVSLRPDFAEVYLNRALVRQGLKDYGAAIRDLTHALDLGATYTRIYFMRARVRELSGDRAGARQDLTEGLGREPTDEKSWIARGIAKLSSDLRGALADFEKAADLNPRSLAALQNQAHVLSELGRNDEALRVLDRLVELYPDYVTARAGRGVLQARLRHRQAAHEAAEDVLARDFQPITLYQVASIFAQTSRQEPDDRALAFRYLAAALRKGFGFEYLETDKDLDPVRDRPEFRKLVSAARALQPIATKPKQPGER